MMQLLFRITAVAAAVLLTGAVVFAQQQPMGGMQPSTQPQNPNAGNTGMNNMNAMGEPPMQKMQDRAFVQDALEGGMGEVQLSQLAEQKGASADVRQYGQKMVQDRTQLDNAIKQVASQIEMRPPEGPSKKDKKLYAKLSTLSGTQFDQAYIKAMVKAHNDDLAAFQQEATNTQNPAIKQVAEEGAQMTRGQLEVIKQMAKDNGVKT